MFTLKPSLYDARLRSTMSDRQPPPAPHPTGSFERGKAKYFHGRTEILRRIEASMSLAVKAKSGTSFLIQAAPGAGKTALLEECKRRAQKLQWKTARIHPEGILDTAMLLHALGRREESREKEKEWSLQIPKIWRRISKTRLPPPLALEIFEDEKRPLLLLLDEAQRMAGIPREPEERFLAVQRFLNSIHNGELGRSVILLAGGLGGTEAAFRRLAVSRFDGGRRIHLGPLSEEATRAIILDWLINDGRVKGDTSKWVDAIASDTHRWPQHIMAYLQPAIDYLEDHDGEMTAAGLDIVLSKGREGRREFYEARTFGLSIQRRHYIAKYVKLFARESRIDPDQFIGFLTNELGEGTGKELCTKALNQGVLDERYGDYVIPIPSMETWLIENYEHYRPPPPLPGTQPSDPGRTH